MRRIPILAVAAALFLSGCENYVIAEKPWFIAEDAVGAQAVRPGWWVEDTVDCRVDAEAPSTAFPDCAHIVLASSDWKGVLWAADGTEHMLVKGDPMIAQYEFLTSEDAAVPSQHAYLYLGFDALKRDAEGRALALRYWPALCGPPRPNHPAAATRRPWRGLHLKKEGGCVADDVRALRGAIDRSRALGTEAPTVRWLREWRPGDQSEADWLAAQGIRTH
jgi:hypothetical protein